AAAQGPERPSPIMAMVTSSRSCACSGKGNAEAASADVPAARNWRLSSLYILETSKSLFSGFDDPQGGLFANAAGCLTFIEEQARNQLLLQAGKVGITARTRAAACKGKIVGDTS